MVFRRWWLTGISLTSAVWLAALAIALGGEPETPPAGNTVTTVAAFYNLPLETMRQGYPVRIEGVVLYGDLAWRMIFLEDATGTLYVELPAAGSWPAFQAGDRLLVEGKTCLLRADRGFADLRLTVLGPGRLPAPVPMNVKGLLDPNRAATYAAVSGVVRNISIEEQLRLLVEIEGRRLTAWMHRHTEADLNGLLDAKVRLVGVAGREYNAKGEVVDAVLYVADSRNLVVEQRGLADPFGLPATPIARLFSRPTEPGATPQRVRVQGAVVAQTLRESLTIRDDTEGIRAVTLLNTPLPKDQRVDVVGFPVIRQGERLLEDAMVRVVGAAKPTAAPQTNEVAPPANLPVIERVADLHRLRPEQAKLHYPVRLKGVVLYADFEWGGLFFHDATDGVYVDTKDANITVEAGQEIELEGFTDPGGQQPMVIKPRFKVLGKRAYPQPVRLPVEVGQASTLDCHWVELEGVVQSDNLQGTHLFLNVVNENVYRCLLPRVLDASLATNLIGARIRVRGAAAVEVNEAGFFAGLRINVSDEKELEVIGPRQEDPFALPVSPIREVLRAAPGQLGGGQLKVRGVITLHRLGLGMFVQDSSAAIYAQLSQTNGLRGGDEVEIVGFRAAGDYMPVLQNAVMRVIGPGTPPKPKELSASHLLKGYNHGELVQLEARLLEPLVPSLSPELLLESEGVGFTAAFEVSSEARQLEALPTGCQLRLTGVCVVKAGEWRQPSGFRLLVRSPADLEVLRRPSRLTPQRVLAFALVSGAVGLAALGWVVALRRQVREKTAQIRQRLEREAALEARYRKFVEQSPSAIVITDTAGNIEYVNPKFTELTGYTLAEVAGRNPRVLKSGESPPERYAELWRTVKSGEEWRGEFKNRRKDGGAYWASCRISPLRDEHGAVTHYLAMQEDVTELRELETQLRHVQKLESIGQLAAGVAHDFNNLLTVIQGHACLLQAQTDLPSEVTEAARDISASAQRAAELTRQLLAFGRRQVLQPRVLNLNQLLGGVSKMVQRLLGAQIRLEISCAPDLPTVRADPGMLEQVIVNLAVNARDAMPNGGRLDLRTSQVRLDAREARLHANAKAGDYVCLTVEDTGCGMKPEVLARLFEPFFTTKDVGKGTGLGLPTVHGIIHQHDGWLQVSSEPGKGTVFKVHLPATGAPMEAARPAAGPSPLPGPNRAILVVEDEQAVRVLAVRTLQKRGYRTFQAANGWEALEIWAKHSTSIDVLVTDMMMPDGLSGRDLAARVLADRPSLPVIYCSGYSPELAGEGMALKEGLNFLQKPYLPTELVRAVEASFPNPAVRPPEGPPAP